MQFSYTFGNISKEYGDAQSNPLVSPSIKWFFKYQERLAECFREQWDSRIKTLQVKIHQQSHYLPESRIQDLKDLFSVYVWELRQSIIKLEERIYEQDFKHIQGLFKVKFMSNEASYYSRPVMK